MIGCRIGKAVAGSARIATRAGLIAAALALVSGEAAAIECPKGWERAPFGQNACVRSLPCRPGLIPQGGACVAPPKTVQPRAPANSAPAACSANLVALYLAEMARQPPARRPAPGSVVALTENGKACVFQMRAAAPPPPTPQRVIVGTQTVDGQTYVFIRTEPVLPLPPSGNYNQFVPAFGASAATVGRIVEGYMFTHTVLGGTDGVPVMVASPYITDGVINAAETSARLTHAGAEAGANWVKNNKAGIAAMAVAIMVSTALPAAPIAAWVLGGEASAAVGTVTEAVIGGMIYSGTEGTMKSVINDFGSNKSAGQQFMNAVGSGGAAALGSIPGSIAGTNVTSIFSPFVAQKTASVIGWGAGAGVDKAVDALGITSAAQTVLSGGFDDPGPQPGGTVLRAAPLSNESLSPRPAFK